MRAVGVPALASTENVPKGTLEDLQPIANVILAFGGTKIASPIGMDVPLVKKATYIVFVVSGLYTIIVWVLSNGAMFGVTAVPADATVANVPTAT